MDGHKTCPTCGRRYDAAATFCQRDGTPLTTPLPSPSPLASAPATPPQDVDPLLGQIVLDHFRIEERIGEGGMGTVYRARQTNLDRDVAIKVLREELLDNPEAVRRFKREAKVATSLDHPNVVRVYLFGELPDGRLYLVMEYLHGRPMTELLDRGPLPLSRALHLVIQTARGIGAAHAMGIVHRDVKPENILVLERGDDPDFVKVLDFGIARLLWDEHTQATQAGTIFGTARYISPEGAAGEPTDMRSDVYSLGILAYQLLAGRTPFDADSPVALLMKHIHQPATPLNDTPGGRYVPEPVSDVIMRALAKNPDAREEDARRFASALEEARRRAAHSGALGRHDETPVVPHAAVGRPTPVTLDASIPGLNRRRRWPTLVGAFILGAAAVTAGALLVTRLSTGTAATQASNDLGARAERALEQGNLVSPPGDNLTELTARMLAANPGDPAALDLRRRASARLLNSAREAMQARHYGAARPDIEHALILTPRDASAAGLLAELERQEREAQLEPGLHFDPEDVQAGQRVSISAVLPLAAPDAGGASTGYFELKRGRARPLRIGASRASERRFIGTHTFSRSGLYVVTLVRGEARGPSVRVRVSAGARRPQRDPPTTVQQTLPSAPTMTVMAPPPDDNGIDWTAPPPPADHPPAMVTPPATMMAPAMAPRSPFVDPPPPPDDAPPPPWTG